jgi:catechol 2,3-dioxygenase-like lactoylglutathione lyase family enzyme
MGTFKIEGVTHWSIPVNSLKEAEEFYGGVLGLKLLGRLNNGVMTCFNVGDHNILLCERERPQDKTIIEERVHHSFTVSPAAFVEACKLFHERKVPIVELEYRAQGYFTGRELYFYDPSGNRLELRDPSWKKGMPEPSFDEIVKS